MRLPCTRPGASWQPGQQLQLLTRQAVKVIHRYSWVPPKHKVRRFVGSRTRDRG
jgi:hypothetical protein